MSTIKLDTISSEPQRPQRRPEWMRVRPPKGEDYKWVRGLMRSKQLHTVCEEAHCPNIGECWGAGTATFLILGDICTRSCGFCDIKTGRPNPIDWAGTGTRRPGRQGDEPASTSSSPPSTATSAKTAARPSSPGCIKRIREVQPGCSIEVLIPDFKGSEEALKIVMDARPEILNHNVETVPRLFRKVQPQDHYEWAMATLGNAKKMERRRAHQERHHGRPGRRMG